MKLAILALTSGGHALAKRLAAELGGESLIPGPQGLAATIRELWPLYDGFIFIMAAGIVVRVIAPLLADKQADPGVVVVDEAGTHAISLLSGHLGGANQLAGRVAAISGGSPVITTASDTLGLTPVDLWARHNQLRLSSGDYTRISSKLVNTGSLAVFMEGCTGSLPPDFQLADSGEDADLIISDRAIEPALPATILRPATLVIGLGCNRGTVAARIEAAVAEAFQDHGLSRQAIHCLASIDLKNDEQGLLEFAGQHRLPLAFFSAQQLNTITGIEQSAAVFAATGAYAVAEPAALLAAQTDHLLIRKLKCKDVTLAVARRATLLTAAYQ